MFDETEIKTDKYLEDIHRSEQNVIDQKTKKNLEMEEHQQEIRLKNVEELFTKRNQEGMKFYTSVDTTEKLLRTGTETNPNHVAEALDSALARLKEIIIKCEKAQEAYASAMTGSGKELTTEETGWIVKIFKVYDRICNECKLFISMHEKREVESTSTPIPTESSSIRPEKMKFEPFSGELRKYPRFKEEFIKHMKPSYKPHEEAFVLKSYLAPDIKEDVDSLGDDATEIWRRLDRKYSDRSKLVDSIMAEIKQLPNDSEDPSEIMYMIKTIERAHRDLKSLGLEREINNSTIVSMMEQKLLTEIKKEWIKIVTDWREPKRIKRE